MAPFERVLKALRGDQWAWWRGLSLVPAFGGVGYAIYTWPVPAPDYGWSFWLWAATLGLILCILPKRTERPAPVSMPVGIGLAAIVVFAAALRIPGIEDVPANISVDEVLPSLESLRIANGESPNVFSSVGWFTIPSLAFAPGGLLVALFPEQPFFAVRLSSMLTGLLGICGTFLLARRFFGDAVALTAAFLMAAGFWHVHNSRTAFPFVQTSCLVPWVLYFLTRARQDRSLAAMGLAGIALGLGLQFYFPVRILVVLVPLFLFVGWIGRRDSLRTVAVESLVLGGMALLSAAPLIKSVPTDTLLGRSQGVLLTRDAIFAERARIYRVESMPAVVGRNLEEALGMFTEWADVCILNRSPDGLFDGVTLAAIVLGALVAIGQARGYALLFLGWAGLVFLLGVGLTDAPRASYRLSPAMPALYILGAFGIHATILASLPRQFWYRITVVPALLAALGAWVTLENYDSFFIDYSKKGDGRAMPPAAAMRYSAQQCAGRNVYFMASPEPLGKGDMLNVFCTRHRPLEAMRIPDLVGDDLPATFIVMSWQRASVARLRECYPNAVFEEHRAPDGRFLFTSVNAELSDVLAGPEMCEPYKPPTIADRIRERMQAADPRAERAGKARHGLGAATTDAGDVAVEPSP